MKPHPLEDLQDHAKPVDGGAVREMRRTPERALHSKKPPALWPVHPDEIARRLRIENGNAAREFLNLTGWRVGSLTVVGLFEYRHKKPSLWCVRCDCGFHEIRVHHKIVEGRARGWPAMCLDCMPAERRAMYLSRIKAHKQEAQQ